MDWPYRATVYDEDYTTTRLRKSLSKHNSSTASCHLADTGARHRGTRRESNGKGSTLKLAGSESSWQHC
jgi:hypothetical protein